MFGLLGSYMAISMSFKERTYMTQRLMYIAIKRVFTLCLVKKTEKLRAGESLRKLFSIFAVANWR